MRRYLPLGILVLVGVGVAGWHIWNMRVARLPARVGGLETAGPLQPPSPAVETAQDFLALWSQKDAAGLYALLSGDMKKSVSQADFAAMAAERTFTGPQLVAKAETAEAAYLIYRVQSAAPAKGQQPLAGYALLLKKEPQGFRVAQIQELDKLPEKISDLRLSPGTDSGWTAKYQDENGQIITVVMP